MPEGGFTANRRCSPPPRCRTHKGRHIIEPKSLGAHRTIIFITLCTMCLKEGDPPVAMLYTRLVKYNVKSGNYLSVLLCVHGEAINHFIIVRCNCPFPPLNRSLAVFLPLFL